MSSLTLTRSLYRSPQNGLVFLLVIVLFFEIIGWAISPQNKLYTYSSYQTLFSYLKNLFLGLLAPEFCTLYIMVFLIDAFHRFLGIRKVNINFSSMVKYEASFLPLFIISFFLFFPITLHVRFLLREFPHYSLNRYIDLYVFQGFTLQTYLMYLPFVVLLGYILVNAALVKDFLDSGLSAKGVVTKALKTGPFSQIQPLSPALAVGEVEKKDVYPRVIEAKMGTGDIYLKLEECYYFETDEERYYVVHPKGRFRVMKPLSILEEELNPLHFFRAHRSYLINLDHLNSYIYWEKGKYIIYMRAADELKEIMMSRQRFPAFKDALAANRSR
ncbi:LytTR family DNA-binding domain-containing protein [Runella slithyformis]|uniref:Response regulator receiver protein n=1 Tax=Runella slithyformis (strain ATCC 29530 / DSM 19594 / LMG 11500 / NCIMB 11436 / LSU 4) TaxID=761193 RepID=A0A7U3ZKA5_RUNSL|nr:LytTR family DNA-binding domain-containing protein [Runella slithyformis]AEI48785.1 response regulator receiver protein [Runella slithyformis DSM 19594]